MEDRGGLVLKVALRVPESRQSCSGKEGADADCGPGPGGGAELRLHSTSSNAFLMMF